MADFGVDESYRDGSTGSPCTCTWETASLAIFSLQTSTVCEIALHITSVSLVTSCTRVEALICVFGAATMLAKDSEKVIGARCQCSFWPHYNYISSRSWYWYWHSPRDRSDKCPKKRPALVYNSQNMFNWGKDLRHGSLDHSYYRCKIFRTVQRIFLYSAPLWSSYMRYEVYRNLVSKGQRKVILRLASESDVLMTLFDCWKSCRFRTKLQRKSGWLRTMSLST